ncbi:manganese efflux pump MntP [Salinisphaera aquimarina]|uniref:Putative manganese efflux pump MntP n=1 Tax=Salinisphaera aquimarina TaxID=2094031 RepID=A0ABV7EPW7_9GAMM
MDSLNVPVSTAPGSRRIQQAGIVSLVTSFSLGVSLSMDAFAASVAQGARVDGARSRNALRTASYLGAFEMLLPVVGWVLGTLLGSFMAQVDHWIAFVLLAGIGGKMIHDAVRHERRGSSDPAPSPGRLLLLAIGTSLDAAAVGVTLVVLQVPILLAALIIGMTTFAMSYAGFMLGGVAGDRMPRYAEIGGGLMLIGIGTRTLLEHTLLA